MGRKKLLDDAKFTNFIQEMEEQFGDNFSDILVDDLEEKETVATDIVSTGAVSLDASIGIGGIPKSKICTIYGPESSGKSTLTLNIAKNFIKNGDKVLYVDVENQTDYEYIRSIIGEDITSKDIVLVQPDAGEDAFKIAEIGIKSKEFGLIIFDSIGAIAPKKEKEDEFEDANVALTSRLITKFLRRNAYSIRVNNVAFIFINQVRDDIGTYMASYSMPGGHALRHYSSLILFLSKGRPILQGKTAIGINTNFTVKKNKLAAPFRTATLPIIFGKGVDFYMDLINFSVLLGVLKKSGAHIYFAGERLGKGMNEAIKFLEGNKLVLDKIVEMVYNSINQIEVKEEETEESEAVNSDE